MEGYSETLAASELPPGALRSVRVGKDLMLLANDGGQIRAIGAICTHEQEELAEGEIEEGCVVCPMHSARFDLQAGADRRRRRSRSMTSGWRAARSWSAAGTTRCAAW